MRIVMSADGSVEGDALTDAITNETALHLVHHPPCPVVVVPAAR